MSEQREVKIGAAKGRPMLTWVGKRPLRAVTAFPAQHVETFDPTGGPALPDPALWAGWPPQSPQGGLLFHGDNEEVLAYLLAHGFRGKVNLIYIDPPFDSGADYVRQVRLRGVSGRTEIEGESYTFGEQMQYGDIWNNDNYLQFMYKRLLLLRELLANDGAIYLHCDYRRAHHLRCLMDEVFSPANHLNSLVWMFSTRSSIKSTWKRTHNDILFYKKDLDPVFNWDDDMVMEPLSEATLKKYKLKDDIGPYRLNGRNIKGSPIRSAKDVDPSWEQSHPEWVVRDYLREGKPATDHFFIDIENQASAVRTDYPTQKPEELLFKLISASSRPGEIVLDCFVGSGTTVAAAQKLGRRWIGCDINKGAIQTTSKRLQGIIDEQLAASRAANGTPLETEDGASHPAQFSFTVWRVNDYDLQIQHNEALEIACKAVGVTRTRTDPFFAGTRGEQLVRVIPFNHALSVTDLEEIRRELEAKPGEDRDILVICLGKELAADAWLENYNRLRRGKGPMNRIEVLELRTDSRYGGFLQHEPATAQVRVTRAGKQVEVVIEDFCSPTIVKRLQQQAGIVQARIEDWRQMVDCVMIDTAYDGEVLNVVLSDVPEKKDDLVAGSYTLPAPKGKTTVAVKIVDMLGEEVLVTEKV